MGCLSSLLPRLAALVLLLASCEGPPESADSLFGQALRQNHPNSLVAAHLTARPPSFPWSFVLLSDTHHPYGDAVFAQIRRQMLQLRRPPAFAVMVGDFVEEGTISQHQAYLAMIDSYPIHFFSVIGNHEMYPGVKDLPEENRPHYGVYHGEEDFSFDFGGSRFIALNDAVPRRDGLTDSQIRWLEKQLDEPATPDRYVFMHAPPSVLSAPWGSPPFFNVERFYELCEKYGVKLVVSGHLHQYRHRLVNGVHYLTTGSGGGAVDPKLIGLQDPGSQAILHSFLLVTLEADGRSRVELIPLGERPLPASSFTFHFATTPASQ